jgi:maleylpyruvate isomerase
MDIMDTDFPHLDETVVATARYLEALTELSDEDVRQPSLLPGWTRAHVITHLARNADALVRVLHGAVAGEVGAMYDSQEKRDADIEQGASRTADELREDAVASAGRWKEAANELHLSQVEAPASRVPGGPTWPVKRVGILRRTEVEVHHADLGLWYSAVQWPDDFVEHLLLRRKRELEEAGIALQLELSDRDTMLVGVGGPVVSGASADVLWWLLGRGAGEGVKSSDGRLPELGPWA